MSNSVRPHRQQPLRAIHSPWDSPGKNTGVGCHFLLQCMKVKSEREVTQSCLTLSDPMDCSPPGSSIHGIFQARVLEWDATALSYTLKKKKEKKEKKWQNIGSKGTYILKERKPSLQQQQILITAIILGGFFLGECVNQPLIWPLMNLAPYNLM